MDAALSANGDCRACAGRLCSLMTSGSCLLMTEWITLPSASAQSGRSSWSGVEDPHWSVCPKLVQPCNWNALYAVVLRNISTPYSRLVVAFCLNKADRCHCQPSAMQQAMVHDKLSHILHHKVCCKVSAARPSRILPTATCFRQFS